ncbi:SAM-dependent methyltransferase [Streptomyces sp. 3MP-14]|uniref:SAM-dependent methyltransferase n=1 Tax=Streptomyces mimosae TaxID=2586635 RepID=A0A5N6A2G2_9ACTN|nr:MULTISPECIES: SAM-dependent methyltransferase [Streptomyces]KAB8162964.1 SAM-dependent methyltransferase [Streptomyces mimosae]KAB8179179.1 SAM-dependent methyltransferase [Streptomyces sp. 3MP-14]
MSENGWPADRIDTGSAHSARIYDYILGGADYYPADKEAGDAMCVEWPALPVHMRANRDWMHRAVRYLAAEAGIRQFLDIGTGIPTSPNLHEIAQQVAPDARVVYMDNDPIVLSLSRGLLTSAPEGRTAYVEADMRDPAGVLAAPELRATLDLDQPVALTVIAIVHFVLDKDDAVGIVNRLLEPLASGSYLAMTIGTADFAPEEIARVSREYAARGMPMRLRNLPEAEAFFEGLELVDPGVVQIHRWRPDGTEPAGIRDEDIGMYGGIARKP